MPLMRASGVLVSGSPSVIFESRRERLRFSPSLAHKLTSARLLIVCRDDPGQVGASIKVRLHKCSMEHGGSEIILLHRAYSRRYVPLHAVQSINLLPFCFIESTLCLI
jgi:hypothetical protein